MSTQRSMDYGAITKWGFALGLALFAIGGLGEIVGHAVFGSLPAWESTLLVFFEGTGVLLCLLVPFIFGIFLPLTE